MKKLEKESMRTFFSWECISIFRDSGTTLDLVIRDEKNMLALLHFLHLQVYTPENVQFMRMYKMMKFKMKIYFECWKRKTSVSELFMLAILRTV